MKENKFKFHLRQLKDKALFDKLKKTEFDKKIEKKMNEMNPNIDAYKISNKIAYDNRKEYFKVFGLNFLNDKDFLFKNELIKEINDLNIPGMPKIKELNPLNGAFVNLKYQLPNGKYVQFLDNNDIYLGTQVECEFNDDEIIRCFGIIANMDFILISEYGPNGVDPEIIIYKTR